MNSTTTTLNPILTNPTSVSSLQPSPTQSHPQASRQPSPSVSSQPTPTLQSKNTFTPRTLSIRFAPLPDPRASRAILPGCPGDSDVWWTREEKPDGTWGDYRLVLRRANGQIVAVDDLDAGSDERIKALETYRLQQLNPRSSPNQSSHPFRSTVYDHDAALHTPLNPNSRLSAGFFDQLLPQPDGRSTKLLPPLAPQNSNSSAGSGPSVGPSPYPPCRPGNPLTLTRTTSRDSTCSINSFSSQNRSSSASALTKKFLETMKKPLARNPNRLTPTSSLPIDYDQFDPSTGAPLCKSRSADSSTGLARKRFGWGAVKIPSSQILRRTRSKDESLEYSNPLAYDEPPIRRRANYPPVAQRKVHIGGGRGGAGKVVLTEEPDFVEWKSATATTPSGVARSSSQAGEEADGDDGSGMAWLRRRKKEREERARREEEERARCMGGFVNQSSLPTINESHGVDGNTANVDDRPNSTIDGIRLEQILPIREEVEDDDDRDSISSSVSQSSILSRDGAHRSGGTRTSTSSTDASSKDSIEDDEDLNEEELREEERLKALALAESPFVKGVTEVYRDREHHQLLRKVS